MWCQESILSMSKSKPPKLDLGSCEDKKEAVELWLDQFNDWCVLQGFRDTTKATNDSDHWKSPHRASEISAFRRALPLDVFRMVKLTIVPTMSTRLLVVCVYGKEAAFSLCGRDNEFC